MSVDPVTQYLRIELWSDEPTAEKSSTIVSFEFLFSTRYVFVSSVSPCSLMSSAFKDVSPFGTVTVLPVFMSFVYRRCFVISLLRLPMIQSLGKVN